MKYYLTVMSPGLDFSATNETEPTDSIGSDEGFESSNIYVEDQQTYSEIVTSEECEGICFSDNPEAVIAASVGAGVIAGIVIGVVAFMVITGYGGKKGYDAWLRHKGNMDGASNNALYRETVPRMGTNPLYSDPEKK